MRTNDAALGEEEPAANPFDARCKDSKHPRELPVGRCYPWTPDTLASCTAADRDPRNPSRGCKAKRLVASRAPAPTWSPASVSQQGSRDTSDVNVLSFEDSENSSDEDIDVRVSTQGVRPGRGLWVVATWGIDGAGEDADWAQTGRHMGAAFSCPCPQAAGQGEAGDLI
ncbi:uncharacterized protein [Equus asinus]|uniref:uncharacterized protein isoform X2 n=1 Tax=Equus asinus TaxID=9793 RepID=UPI0038F7B820